MSGKAQWFTPINAMKNKEEVWARLERSGWSSPKLDTSKPITFFNNPLKWQWSAEYDRFFAYTKIFPLWDQRKPKDNCQYLPDIRENIYEQEKDKPVPVLTSYNYGLPCRRLLDQPETGYRRIQATGDFKRRRGVMKVIEKKPQ
ncbi:hypothetical protein MTP99_001410 [Tenebrio molitor]|uniref:uncharacterized protein n=1 Tax=Tenebrio molitor TaxID=7067 RepID=UPI001C3B8BC0|nr:hypothetical protein MTP99_001410 [Tenebrio molitor]CAH1365117.1 unnamed protein product [Tenebrio molitor]